MLNLITDYIVQHDKDMIDRHAALQTKRMDRVREMKNRKKDDL